MDVRLWQFQNSYKRNCKQQKCSSFRKISRTTKKSDKLTQQDHSYIEYVNAGNLIIIKFAICLWRNHMSIWWDERNWNILWQLAWLRKLQQGKTEKIFDGITKWLNVGWVTHALQVMRDRGVWKVMVTYTNVKSKAPDWLKMKKKQRLIMMKALHCKIIIKKNK